MLLFQSHANATPQIYYKGKKSNSLPILSFPFIFISINSYVFTHYSFKL